MRKYGKIDLIQHEIVQGLRETGHTVLILSSMGMGCPDILVGRGGVNILEEIKLPKGKLTDDQVDWHCKWKGQVAIVRSLLEAITAVNEAIKKQGGGKG